MKDDRFWELIDKIDRVALAEGSDDRAMIPLRAALSRLSRGALEAFQEQLSQKLYALDGRVFAEASGESGQSGDGFLYLRCFVVACGKRTYQAALANPELMPKSTDDWCEALISVAWTTYERTTGKDWEYEPSVSYETGSNGTLWAE